MIYSTDLIKDITFEDILAKTSEYDVYKYYIGKDFYINRIMSSPFREDKHPSFGIYKNKQGSLVFKDQATGDSGNCITLIMLIFNIKYHDALKKIWFDFNLNRLNISPLGKQISKQKPQDNVILVQRKNWCETDEQYWSQYSITKEDLKEYNVFPIQCFWINDSIQSFKYTKDCPMYAYSIFNKFKIYRPYADKSEKWRTNAGTYDIQGYEQLPDKCDPIIITKSLKDIIVLNKLGYTAIAPNSENHTIPEVIINKLRKDKGTTKFTIFYDNDEAGDKASTKLCNKYNFKEIWLDSVKAKDISDFVKLYGLNKAKEWMMNTNVQNVCM